MSKSASLYSICLLAIFTFLSNCNNKPSLTAGPYFGNGLHNGWADQHSITLWTRLTETPDANMGGSPFLEISNEEQKELCQSADPVAIHAAQIPRGLTLKDMIGACPGAPGEVRMSYHPVDLRDKEKSIDWQPVAPGKNFTLQWKLNNLQSNTPYQVRLEARAKGATAISDTLIGYFRTAPDQKTVEDIRFCVVTCHDFIRRDVPDKGHQIYPAMAALQPDFYVHAGDIEYYDKPLPYACTEALMRFKWDRLFALPYQRSFFNQTTTYFLKDDHDALANDTYPGMTYGQVSYERGLEIFDKEQFPSNNSLYKTIRWGKDLQIWIVEGRNFRSKNSDPDGPEKTIWGKAQKEWFYKTVEDSEATFKILMTSTPILGPDRKKKSDNYSNSNFQYEGQEIRDFINQQKHFYICNGDRHWQYATHFEGTNLWEFSAGAGADAHAGGWKQEDLRPEHRFLRVKGGFLSGHVSQENGKSKLLFQHHDVAGNVVHQEVFFSAFASND